MGGALPLPSHKMATTKRTIVGYSRLPEVTIAELRTTVNNLAHDITEQSARLSSFSSKIDEKFSNLYNRLEQIGRPNWTTYAAWGGVIISAFTFFAFMTTQWITLRITPIEFAQTAINTNVEKEFSLARDDRDKIRSEARYEREQLKLDLAALRSSVFPLEVHRQRWELYDTEIKTIQQRHDELARQLGNLYNPADKFKELQQQIDSLRLQLDRRLNGGPTP